MNIITLSLGVDIPYTINADGCWICQLAKNKGGYPIKRIKGRAYRATRLILEEKLGRSIKPDYHACHACDNPSCINPSHLWEGNRSENIRDAMNKGRFKPVAPKNGKHFEKGHISPHRKLSEEQAQQIRCRATEPQRHLAKEFGVSQKTIYRILSGLIYR